MNDKQPELNQKYLPGMKPPYPRQTMPIVGGRPFRCECNCNVFTQNSPTEFVCNACEATYHGSPKEDHH